VRLTERIFTEFWYDGERLALGAVSSSSFERLPELADKLRTTYNVERDVLREILFRNALEEGELDNDLEQIYPGLDLDEVRQYASAADFPNYIPFEGYDIDPDNETLSAYRLASENPKAREFVEQNSDLDSLLPGGTVESARTAYLQAINSGALTPQQREALRYAGESRFLSDANYRSDAGQALDTLLQAYPVSGSYGTRSGVDYSQNLENVADILEQADEVIRPVEVGLGARETMLRYADSDTVARDPLASRIDQNNIQLGLPLRGRDFGIAERYAAIRDNPPQTIEELNAQAAEIRALRQATGREGPINTFPIEGSTLLPQVADLLAPESSPRRREFLLEQAERQARDPNRNTLYQLQRDLAEQAEPSVRSRVEDARRMRTAVNMSPAEIDPIIPTVTNQGALQFALPGLEDQLLETREAARQEAVKEQAKELNKFVEKYPEIGPYLQGVLDNPTPKIERNIEKLSPYLDLEQEISKPEARQGIYNLAMKELGVQPSYLSQIELDYTSGDTAKQKEAIDKIVTMGYGEQLQAGSSPALSRRMPVVGGGGYARGRELQDALSFISNRANEFENIDNTPTVSSMSSTSGPLAIKNPNLSAAPSRANFSYDPDTGVAYPDPAGEYGIRINTNPAPTRVRLGTNLPISNEVSRNVLNYLRDNPVTRMSSVSFETQTPTEDFDYSAKEIPAPVFEQMNKFITENVLRNMRPGMLLENSPIGTADLARLREEQGKSLSESSILRRQEEFKGQQPNRRGAAYRSVGFGPLTDKGNQLLYMNSEGNIVPLQVDRPAPSLAGSVNIVDPRPGDPQPLRAEVTQSREPLTSKAYYSMNPVSMAAQGVPEYVRALRRTPAALLPGAADLIPSPEAIQTGYREGLGPMAQQMGREFVQSLPQAVGYSAALAAAPVLAPGVGAGMVGTAGAQALNEVVRQETGEGIVPKLRQAIGTAPRTGVANPARTGPQPLTAQVRPLTQAQRTEQQRQQNRSELQRRLDLAGERFNPRRGEFGLSELLFGR
jgi:hypothetical protein